MKQQNLGFCGVDCAMCPIFLASAENDVQKKTELAQIFSERYKTDIKAENVNCDGCLQGTYENGTLFYHCQACDVRKSAAEKNVKTCAECDKYVCDKLIAKWDEIPDEYSAKAKENLEASAK